MGGLGNRRVRKLAVNGFGRTAQSLRLPSVNPKGLKTFTLSFTVSAYAAGGLQRPGGRKQAVTNRDVQRSPSVLPYTFGAPVSGGEGLRRTVIKSDSFTQPGPLGVAGSL